MVSRYYWVVLREAAPSIVCPENVPDVLARASLLRDTSPELCGSHGLRSAYGDVSIDVWVLSDHLFSAVIRVHCIDADWTRLNLSYRP